MPKNQKKLPIETVAFHEAGHAVMRWLCGLPAGRTAASQVGGICEGSGKEIDAESFILVSLAGYAVECNFGIEGRPDLESQTDDFNSARAALYKAIHLRMRPNDKADSGIEVVSVGEAMIHYYDKACKMLWDNFEVVDNVATALIKERVLTSRQVSTVLRKYKRNAESVTKPKA